MPEGKRKVERTMRCFLLAVFALVCYGLAECSVSAQVAEPGYTKQDIAAMDALVIRSLARPFKHKAMTAKEQAAAMVYLWGEQ
jgi:hypothetical protein